MKVYRRWISTVLVLGLVVGMIGAGVVMRPMEAKAETLADAVSLIETNSMPRRNDVNDYQKIDIPAVLEVVNKSDGNDGANAYTPKFNAYIVAKPVKTGIYYPVDYATDHPSIESKTWFSGRFNVDASNVNKFGDGKKVSISSTSNSVNNGFGYCKSWFTGKNGIYRYRIYFCDDAYGTYSNMFTIPEMANDEESTRPNVLLLDFHVSSSTVNGVVLLDGDDHKLISGTVDNVTNTAEEPGVGAATIKYNVANITLSNTILGKGKSHYRFIGTINKKDRDAGPDNYLLDPQNDGKSTASYDGTTPKFTINDTEGKFSYTIKNFPIGWGITYKQTDPENIENRLQVYYKIGTDLPSDSISPDDWKAESGDNSYKSKLYTKGDQAEISEVTVDGPKDVSFVSAAVIPLPPTGIMLTISPYIILIILAGGLLAFFIKRKDDSEG